MTPTTAELLTGNFVAFTEAPPPESAGEFMAGMVGVTGMISLLAAQEADRGVAMRAAENADLRSLFARVAEAGWDDPLDQPLAEAAAGRDDDLGIPALDAANAALRRGLITLQLVAEANPRPEARALEAAIMALLRRMADGRALHLPPMPGRR